MLKKTIIIISLAIIALISFSYFTFNKEEGTNKDEGLNANEESISVGGVDLLVDIADEPQEQTQGLSGREKMAENKGMLFIFPQPLSPGFWMKDMRFSLDIIWIDQNGMIVGISENISPNTFPNSFFPPSPIKYVLEVNAGWSNRHRVNVGDKMILDI